MPSSTLHRRGTLAAILAAGCLLAPTAMADTAEGPWLRDSATLANTYDPPSSDTSAAARPVAPPAQPGPPRASVRPAHSHPTTVSADGVSAWAVIGVALGCIALLGGAGVAVMRRVRRAQRAVV